MRWQMLITSLDHKPRFYNTFLIMMSGYFVNTAIPRLGEVTKCAFMTKKEKVPFSISLGTVVLERLVDLIMLGIIVLLVFTTQNDLLSDFFARDIFGPIVTKATGMGNKFWMIVGVVAVAGIYFAWDYLNKTSKDEKKVEKLDNFADNMMLGITSFQKLDKKWLFVVHTLFIWVMYFFMTYTCFFSIEATSGLSIAAGIALVAIGSLGRSVPIQAGGMGAYHYVISSALVLYGIGKEQGLALATIIHAAQTLFYLVLGGLSMLLIALTKDAEQTPAPEAE